jgi:hypothetical protein
MFSQEQADQTFLDEVGRLHPMGGTVGDLDASKKKFPKLYKETVAKVKASAANPADASWKEFAKTQYGWVTELYDAVPEVQGIVDAAVSGKWTADRFTNAIQSTEWWKTTEAKQRNYTNLQATDPATLARNIEQIKGQIDKIVGTSGYALDDAALSQLADSAYRFGWNQTEMEMYAGAEIVKSKSTGIAGKPLSQGIDANSVRQWANDYGLKLSDDGIMSYTDSLVSKTLTPEQVKQNMLQDAENLYPSLKGQLASGRTVAQATSTYRQLAANALNIDPNTVDFTDSDKWGKLLSYRDPNSGEARLMNGTEWSTFIRTLPEWQKTDEAKTLYRDIGSTILRGFGALR